MKKYKTLNEIIRQQLKTMHKSSLKRICFDFGLTWDKRTNWYKITKESMIAIIMVRIVNGKNREENIDILLNNYIPAPEI